MEDILRAIVLGIVQGLTEFLPISSSGHLILVRETLGWDFAEDLVFDVSLHIGTTVAVLVYFWRDWLSMFRSALAWLGGDRQRHAGTAYDARVLMLIVLGSIPIVIAGFAFGDWIEDEIRDPVIVGVALIVGGIVLYAADRLGSEDRTIRDGRPFDAVFVGVAQALALIPGVSRSGITISAGLTRGFTRQDAARFSFLLSTPAIGGAAALTLGDAISEGVIVDQLDVILAGAITAGIVGWLSIKYLLQFLQTHSFLPFVLYRLVVGTAAIVYFAA